MGFEVLKAADLYNYCANPNLMQFKTSQSIPLSKWFFGKSSKFRLIILRKSPLSYYLARWLNHLPYFVLKIFVVRQYCALEGEILPTMDLVILVTIFLSKNLTDLFYNLLTHQQHCHIKFKFIFFHFISISLDIISFHKFYCTVGPKIFNFTVTYFCSKSWPISEGMIPVRAPL